MNEQQLSRFLHTRSCAMLMLGVACALAVVAFVTGDIGSIGGTLGIGISPVRTWVPSPLLSLIVSLGCTLLTGVLMIYINRVFNVLRSITNLASGLFFIMVTALPPVMDRFYGGDIAGVLLMICIALLFTTFADPTSQRHIFLIFFLITLAAFSDISFALYIPVFLLGCMQMRVFGLRTFLAALMGIVTPPWILFGFGLVTPDMLHWPEIQFAWSAFDNPHAIIALTVTGFTLLCGVGFTVANLLKILSYNSRVRAYNGFLTLMLISTAAFTLVNFNNFTFYIPLLDILTAYQIAHFFTYRRFRRSYIPIMLLIAIYIGFYIWSIINA